MVSVVDYLNGDDEQGKQVVLDHIKFLLNRSFNSDDLDTQREAVDRAIKQEFDDGYVFGHNRITDNQQLNRFQAESQEYLDGQDEFSSLYIPLLLSLYRAWMMHTKNAIFPANGDWVDIKRKNSRFFNKYGIAEFLPNANEAWVNILKTENQRFGFKEKYTSSLAENITYGNTGLLHFYDEDNHYVDVKVPGIKDVSIFPETDRWEESNIVIRYDVNYADLKRRGDFNQEFVSVIKPSMKGGTAFDGERMGSSRRQEEESNHTPYGKVRLYDIYIPSVYLDNPDSEGEAIQGDSLYITVAKDANVVDNFSDLGINNGDTTFILKVSQGVDKVSHGIRLAKAGPTLPGVFYHQGFLIPFLPHQVLLNQMVSGASRTTAMIVDPPLQLIRDPSADFEQTPPDEFAPGAQYEGYNVSALIPPEYYQVINQFQAFSEYIQGVVEKGSGLSRQQMGVFNDGKRSAAEVREVNSAGQMGVADVSSYFDEQVLQPSITNRIQRTQRILKEQIEEVVGPYDPELLDIDFYEEVLEENELFVRLLEFSGLEEAYEEFYQRKLHEAIDNKRVKQELEGMLQQIQSLQEFAASEIPPFIAPPSGIDPQTGMLAISDAEIDQMEAAHVQQEEMARDNAIKQAQSLQLEVEMKTLQLKDITPVPEPSLFTLYQILTAPISESDVIITGSKTSLSKDLMRANLANYYEFLGKLPPEVVRTVDLEQIHKGVVKASDLGLTDIRKDEATIRKEEEQVQKQAQLEQQLRLKMAENPGSQVPK